MHEPGFRNFRLCRDFVRQNCEFARLSICPKWYIRSPMRKGIPVSPGVAVGTAFCIHEIFVNPDTKRLEDNEITAELANFETARDKAATELRALQHKVEQQVGHEEAAHLWRPRSRSSATPSSPTRSAAGSSTTA